MSQRLCSGNQMVAEGALAAGCKFFAGYPITPASEIYEVMMRELPAHGGLALSAPDEISSLCYCVGASLRGLKAMTATSGPGWALMVETLQYALMTETPLVIVLVQRLGPSTGGATQGSQGDVWLAEFATSGGYTIPIFAPSTAAECFELTVHAFNWSERLRTPVVVLSDKEVGMTTEVVDEEAGHRPTPVERRQFAGPGEYLPYGFARLEEVPEFAPVGGAVKVTVTGSAHDQQGRLRKNAPEVLEVLRHLERKIEAHADKIALVRPDLDPGAPVLLLGYGVTARACRQAVAALRRENVRVSFLQLQTLFPIPRRALDWALAEVETVVVAEENLTGQYRAVLAPYLAGKQVVGINKVGTLIPPSEIVRVVRGLET
ncbi:MAG: pyruvate flavodoxin/ferredoxin oxidoreductase [Acidobacteria bacterium]|nr:pyruvate flavodoxin/ferredoxin oxidoreductase [Acidobacteriota bacterium]